MSNKRPFNQGEATDNHDGTDDKCDNSVDKKIKTEGERQQANVSSRRTPVRSPTFKRKSKSELCKERY